ncbi:MAG: hypothetical protein BWZ04_02767 [Firmicutes bacterium ADurb.BinA205]|nr:MAG: hypothetical protein BWZ04_02767 [Firmicutes bacterium ADurb.BinA205]
MCKADGLSAVLIRGDLCNDLRCDIAGSRKAVRLLNHSTGYHCAVLKHILQIHQTAIVHRLCDVVQIVYMNDPVIMGGDHILRKQESAANVSADLSRHIVTERAVDDRVLVGVLLFCLLVVAFEQAQDLAVCGVQLALLFMKQSVFAVVPCKFVRFGLVQFIENHVLDFFDMDRSCKGVAAFFYITDNEADSCIRNLSIRFHLVIRRRDSGSYLFTVIRDFSTVPFDNLQCISLLQASCGQIASVFLFGCSQPIRAEAYTKPPTGFRSASARMNALIITRQTALVSCLTALAVDMLGYTLSADRRQFISFSASSSSSSQVLLRYFLHWLFRISRTTDCSSAVSSMPYIFSLSSASEFTTIKVMLLSS